VIVVGYRDRRLLDEDFRGCRITSRFDNGFGVDNEEQGGTLAICSGPRLPWRMAWPRLAHLNA
jgi:hypothetical protein